MPSIPTPVTRAQCAHNSFKVDDHLDSPCASTHSPSNALSTDASATTDLYSVLGVNCAADTIEIRAAFRKLALLTHPDRSGGSTAAFQRVVAAFEVLSDSERRRDYDEELQNPRCGASDSRKKKVRTWSTPEERDRGRTPREALTFPMRLSTLLRQMSASCRRDVIAKRLTRNQRLELEEHLQEHRRPVRKSVTITYTQPCARPQGGIKRCGGILNRANHQKIYGYSARVAIHGFGLVGILRKDLVSAITDHIFLARVAEGIRSNCDFSHFPTRVHRAVARARDELGPTDEVIAYAEVFFSNSHFIGNTVLKLAFPSLNYGLFAWEQLQKAKGVSMFKGAGVTDNYTPLAAKEQFVRMKAVFVRLALTNSCAPAHKAEVQAARVSARLEALEEAHQPARLERDCQLWRRAVCNAPTPDLAYAQSSSENTAAKDADLLQRLEQLLRGQRILKKRAAQQLKRGSKMQSELGKCKQQFVEPTRDASQRKRIRVACQTAHGKH